MAATTYAQKLVTAKALLDARIGGQPLDSFKTGASREWVMIPIGDLMRLIDWLEKKAGDETATTSGRRPVNYVKLKDAYDSGSAIGI